MIKINIVITIQNLQLSCVIAYFPFTGLVINSIGGHNDLKTLRIPGVLQRFAICYCVVGLVEVLLVKRKKTDSPAQTSTHRQTESYGTPVEQCLKPYFLRDLPELKWHFLIFISFLFIHSCVIFLMPLPDGCPTGYLGPAGYHEGGKYFNCTGGATVKICRNNKYVKGDI